MNKKLPVVNMVFHGQWDWVFAKMLEKYTTHFTGQYNIHPSVVPILDADVYQYWRPASNRARVHFKSIAPSHPNFIRAVHMIHDSPFDIARHQTVFRKSTIKNFRHILCTSKEQFNFYSPFVSEDQLVYIPLPPLNLPPALNASDIGSAKRIRIGFSARRYTDGVKGEDLLCAIADRLDPEKFEFVLNVKEAIFNHFGRPSIETYLRRRFDVNMTSTVDVQLITSKYEGTPLPLIEALASGIYVLSTRVGEAPVVLPENNLCLNNPHDFASKLKKLEQHRDRLQQFHKITPALVSDRTWPTFFRKNEELWLNIMHETKKPRTQVVKNSDYDDIRAALLSWHASIPRFMVNTWNALPFKHKTFITNNFLKQPALIDNVLVNAASSFYIPSDDKIIEHIRTQNLTHVMVWNGGMNDNQRGYQVDLIKRIQESTPAKVIFMEHGWLPQSDHVIIDDMGSCGGSSIVAMRKLPKCLDHTPELEATRDWYTRQVQPVPFKDFLYMPLQLNTDTQITEYSPHFKLMEELIHHVSSLFPTQLIVVKGHPKDTTTNLRAYNAISTRFSNLVFVNDKKNISYCAKAKGVIAINSTAINEALLFHQPVMSYGVNVFSNKGVTYEVKDINDVYFQLAFLEFKPNVKMIDRYLCYLLHRQLKVMNPDINKALPFFI